MRALTLLVWLPLLGACGGGGLEGTYSGEDAATGEGTGFLDSITFKSGNRIEATFLGQTKRGTYSLEGKQVTLKVADDDTPEVLTIIGPPGEAPMVLTRDGDALVMTDGAESVRFLRQ